MNLDLRKILNPLPFPVLVCDRKDRRILCINEEARLLAGRPVGRKNLLEDVLHCRYESDLNLLWKTLETKGNVHGFALSALDVRGNPVNLSLSAHTIALPAERREIVVLCLAVTDDRNEARSPAEEEMRVKELLLKMLSMAYHPADLDRTINGILEILGIHLDVCRTCIFEDSAAGTSSKTYEWCAPGVESQMTFCQNFSRDAFPWDEIRDGLYVADSTAALPEKERLLLESQGIRALVAFPLFINDSPVGFIGCEECRRDRIWTREELRIIRSAVAVVSTLLSRKRALQELRRYQEIMRTVLDNIEAVIYVSDFDTGEILFANRYLKQTLVEKGEPLPDIEGRICWQTLQKGQEGPCSFCPNPRLLNRSGRPAGTYTWEHKNTILNRWYLVTDSAIRWVDGRYVHMENARDISDLKQKEEELREKANELKAVASTDSLTGIYNRQMGGVLLEEAYKRVQRTRKKSTLCFLDLDGLKNVNDTLGHREGDRMLVGFAGIVRAVIRSVDIFCRWGGDEFILLLEGCDSTRAEELTIRRIRAHVDRFNRIDREKTGKSPLYSLAFSYGLEEIDFRGSLTLDQIVAAADRKMYDDKIRKKSSAAGS